MSVPNIFYVVLLLSCCFHVLFGFATKSFLDDVRLSKRDVKFSSAREEMHVRVLKFTSGRYNSIPITATTEEPKSEAIEGPTAMEPQFKVTTTSAPDEINMKVFGGYFNSLLGSALAYHFGVTSKLSTTPPYAVTHYFFPKSTEEFSIINQASVSNCNSDAGSICIPKTNPMCLPNGTVYCVTPMEETMLCLKDGEQKRCLETTLKLPCRKKGTTICEKAIPVHIPCYVDVNVVRGDECMKKKIYSMKYCVIVIAYPVKQYANDEFLERVYQSEDGKRVMKHQFDNFLNAVGSYVLH